MSARSCQVGKVLVGVAAFVAAGSTSLPDSEPGSARSIAQATAMILGALGAYLVAHCQHDAVPEA